MAAAPRGWAADLLHYWFHVLREDQWFRPGPETDHALRRRFARALAAMAPRPASEFLRDPATARAAILLFDQIPRNIFRGSRRAFAYDPQARAIAHGLLERGWDTALAFHQRHFAYMPLMHSERIADQRLSIALFAGLGDVSTFQFARSHYRMIARFGRFPHRNEVLGRCSTPAEARAVREGNAW